MTLEDLQRYRPAAVADQFYQEKNATAAKGSLEKLVNTLDVGKDGPALLEAIKKSEKGDQNLANIYASEYQEILMNSKIKDLFKFYSSYFEKYVKGDSYGEAVKVFEQYGDENYKDMLAKVIEAKEKINSKSPNVTEEDKQKAQETIKEYGRITSPIQSFEQLEMEKLSNPVAKAAMKKDFTAMFNPEKKSE